MAHGGRSASRDVTAPGWHGSPTWTATVPTVVWNEQTWEGRWKGTSGWCGQSWPLGFGYSPTSCSTSSSSDAVVPPATLARAGSIVAGASVAALVAARHFSGPPRTLLTSVVDAVYLTVAVLLMLREPASEPVPLSHGLSVLPAVVASGAVLAAAPPPDEWPMPSTALVVAGAAWTIASLVSLGRSFGVAPAERPLVTRGPYACVRHPAYLGELALVVGVASATGAVGSATARLVTVGAVAALVPATAWRIAAEEDVCRQADGWAEYVAAVPGRLIPAPRALRPERPVASSAATVRQDINGRETGINGQPSESGSSAVDAAGSHPRDRRWPDGGLQQRT